MNKGEHKKTQATTPKVDENDINSVVRSIQSKMRPLIKKPLSDQDLKEALRNYDKI